MSFNCSSSVHFVKILTSVFQMTNTIQKKFKVSSTQLLYQSCPYQALTLFIVGPFLDGLLTNKNVFAFKYTPQVLVRIKEYVNHFPDISLFYCFWLFYALCGCSSSLFYPAWFLSLWTSVLFWWLERHLLSPIKS